MLCFSLFVWQAVFSECPGFLKAAKCRYLCYKPLLFHQHTGVCHMLAEVYPSHMSPMLPCLLFPVCERCFLAGQALRSLPTRNPRGLPGTTASSFARRTESSGCRGESKNSDRRCLLWRLYMVLRGAQRLEHRDANCRVSLCS